MLSIPIETFRGMEGFAMKIAAQIGPGDIILLDGTLGAGKTTLVRSIVRSLGFTDPVTSPTFTFANFYKTSSLLILHADAYRIESEGEFDQLGLDEYMDECCTFIEWGSLVRRLYRPGLEIGMFFGESDLEEAREVSLTPHTGKWHDFCNYLRMSGVAQS